MRLKVPFYKQTTPLNCGPVALQMVLSYFGDDVNLEVLEELTELKEGKGVSTLQIGIAAAMRGFKAEFFTKHLLLQESNLELDFYKKYNPLDLEQSKRLLKDAQKLGIEMHEKTISVHELLHLITENTVPIVLVDWSVIKNRNERGYQGHFLPLIGYDEKNVYVHNHGFEDTGGYMKIDKELFDKSRKAKGTDEDIVIIYRK